MTATCPDHGEVELIESLHEIRVGLWETLVKVMHIGRCPKEGCKRWCEVGLDYVLWN